MTTILLDTNILLRECNLADSQHALVHKAIMELHFRNHAICVTPQVLIEFRNVATRPVNQNGLGLSPISAASETARFKGLFQMLPDVPDIFPTWESIVEKYSVSGKQVHDARLAAVCEVYGIHGLLTFNDRDFIRYQSTGQGFSVVNPNNLQQLLAM